MPAHQMDGEPVVEEVEAVEEEPIADKSWRRFSLEFPIKLPSNDCIALKST